MRTTKSIASIASVAVALLLGGCADWLGVDNPGVIDQGSLDPVADADVLSRSAIQNLASAYGHVIVYSSWFTGETDVSETFPTRNEFGRRDISIQNGSLDTDVWFPLSQAVKSSYIVLGTALPDTASNIHYARANFVLGFAYLFMAEQFCQGTVLAGPPLTTQNMLDSSVAHFAVAISQGRLTGIREGDSLIKNAAWVGTARANLQAGNLAQAIAAGDSVLAGFTYTLKYIDDLAQRLRLANRMWFYVRDRGSIAVAPTWRIGPQLAPDVVQNAEPRVPWKRPATSGATAYAPQDAAYSTDRGIPYAIQFKFPDYTTPVRLASKLEANYITAEAQGTVAQKAMIDARRAANGQPAVSITDPDSTLTEFFTQRGLDFFLEGKRMGDSRRHPTNIIGMPVPASTYWKPGFAPVGSNICYPLPITETDNNPNF